MDSDKHKNLKLDFTVDKEKSKVTKELLMRLREEINECKQ